MSGALASALNKVGTPAMTVGFVLSKSFRDLFELEARQHDHLPGQC